MSLVIRTWALGIAVSFTACTPPPQGATGTDAGSAGGNECRQFGQTCTFSPGKLGTCVQKPECAGDGCLVCQSQH